MLFNETLPDCCSPPACSESLRAGSFQAAVNICSFLHRLIKDGFVFGEDVFDSPALISVFLPDELGNVGFDVSDKLSGLLWCCFKWKFYISFKGKKTKPK